MAALLALSPNAGGWAFDNPLAAGIAAYHDGDYRAAADRFAEAVTAAPQDSRRHHWLGKSYGRIAEHGNWFVSMSYAKKDAATISHCGSVG